MEDLEEESLWTSRTDRSKLDLETGSKYVDGLRTTLNSFKMDSVQAFGRTVLDHRAPL